MSNPNQAVQERLTDPVVGISTNPSPPPRTSSTSRFVQCTHMTTTRMYNPLFRCSLCFRHGEFGWLYRCTQDCELFIENALEKGKAVTIDNLSDILGPQQKERMRSPAARVHAESFFDEIDGKELRSYTPQQINAILEQRRHAVRTANENEPVRDFGQGLQIDGMSSFPGSHLSGPSGRDIREKPWLPAVECQLKVCHRCRPGFADRSFLSLDAILNGEVPPTAATGFGFPFHQTRPISLVTHVRNLGLRPNPPNTPSSKVISTRSPHSPLSPKFTPLSLTFTHTELPTPFNDVDSADTTFGQDSNAYDSAVMTRNLNAEAEKGPILPGHMTPFQEAFKMMEKIAVTNEATLLLDMCKEKEKGTGSIANSIKDAGTYGSSSSDIRPPWTPPGSTILNPGAGGEVDKFDLDERVFGRSDLSLKTNLSLRSLHNLDLGPVQHDGDVGLFLPLNSRILNRAAAVSLPHPTSEEKFFFSREFATTDAPKPTALEIAEVSGSFSKEPVEQHVPDLVLNA